MVSICQEMHWTYHEYLNQPDWFIGLLQTKMTIDNQKMKKEIEKMRNKSKQ